MNSAWHKNCCNLFSFLVVCACCISSFVNCNEVFCGEAPQIPNAQPDLQGLSHPFQNGTNIIYNCIDGFALRSGANPHVVCVVENETALWSYERNALCSQACVDLPDIPHATLSTEGKEPPFLPGVKIPVRCKPGYISGGFVLQIECILSEGNAAWSLPIQSCTPRSCGFPGDIENAERTGNIFTFPNTVTYACKEGYKLKGRATLYCMPSGSWNPSLPSCEAIICPILSHPQNGRVVSLDRHYGATANYECEKGFRVEGPSQRTCGLDSQWSGSSPVCTVVTCLPLGELENIRIVNEKETYSFNDFVIFTCLYNKVSLSSKCLESGHWSKRPPICPGPPGISKPETTEPPTTTIPPTKVTTKSPGHVNASSPITSTIPPTTKDTTNSLGHHKPVSSPITSTIPSINTKDTTNSSGHHKLETDTARIIDTTPPVTKVMMNSSGYQNDTPRIIDTTPPKTKVVMNSSGYQNASSPITSTIPSKTTKDTTNSSGRHNLDTPRVIDTTPPVTKVVMNSSGYQNESKCEDPGDIPHGQRTASGFLPGSNVTYTCEDGYDLRGKRTLICLGTGKWDLDKLPICVEPIPTGVIVGIVVGIILVAGAIAAVIFYRWKANNPKGYGKKSKALATDATDQEEIARLDKGKKSIPVTVL